jgi:hypothetical protein
MIYKQPYLEKYKGVGSRHRCPGCGRAKTFTYYLDGETNRVINPRVGRCDREKKCGYHYTPKQYFAEHGGERGDLHSLVDEVPVKRATVSYIAERYVDESMSGDSNFVRFLTRHFEESKVAKAVDEYRLGATRNGSVIFWQIDVKGKVRTGKIMQYDIGSCKRVKGQIGSVGWVHTRLAKKHVERYGDFELKQCYFGEHLLEKYPEKPVAVVESEKTAVVCSMIYDEFVWLATGSLHGLSVEKSTALEGRYVMLFPDGGCREQWVGKAREIKASVRCEMRVSDVVERYACDEQKEDGCDLADYVLERVVGALAESDDAPQTGCSEEQVYATATQESEATQTGCSGGTHRAVKETDEGANRVTATGDVSGLEVAVETHECEGVDSDTIDVTEYEGCDDDGVFIDDEMRKLLDRGMRRARCMWKDGGEDVSTEHEREEQQVGASPPKEGETGASEFRLKQVEASPPKEGEMRVEAYEKESSPGEGLNEMSSTLRGMVEERPELQLLIEEFGLVEVDMSRYD